MPRARRRVPFWDNARFACIVLVVLGHATQRLTYDSDIALGLYLLIFAFHMPAFAIISGYFSKSDAPEPASDGAGDHRHPAAVRDLRERCGRSRSGSSRVRRTRISPSRRGRCGSCSHSGIFRLVLPYLALLRWPLLWTVAISIGAGYLPNIDSTLSLSRTLGLLPFFTLGWWLREHDIVERFGLAAPRPWWVSRLRRHSFAAAGWAAWFFVDGWRAMNLREWLFYDENYSSIGGTEWWAGGVRLALMVVAIVLSGGVLRAPAAAHALLDALRAVHDVRLPAALLRALPVPRVRRAARSRAHVALAARSSSSPRCSSRWGSPPGPCGRLFRPLVEPRPAWLFADPTLAPREGRRSDPTGSRRPPEQPRPAQAHPDPRQNG